MGGWLFSFILQIHSLWHYFFLQILQYFCCISIFPREQPAKEKQLCSTDVKHASIWALFYWTFRIFLSRIASVIWICIIIIIIIGIIIMHLPHIPKSCFLSCLNLFGVVCGRRESSVAQLSSVSSFLVWVPQISVVVLIGYSKLGQKLYAYSCSVIQEV